MFVDTHASLKIEVWDKDVTWDDLLGSYSRTLSTGMHTFTCYAKNGGVEIRYTLSCDQHLTGSRCHQYKPVP
uniref:Lectin n=1 Tax=Knipowitschia caucasica TaxID=637954 RepID=A0AAV2LME3_KNICA